MKHRGWQVGLTVALCFLVGQPGAYAEQKSPSGATASAAVKKKKDSAVPTRKASAKSTGVQVAKTAKSTTKQSSKPVEKKKAGTTKTQSSSSVKTAQRKEELEQKRKTTQNKIEKIESEVSEKNLEKKKLEDELAASAAAISKTRQKITSIQKDRKKVEVDLRRQQTEIRKLQAQIEAEQKVLDKTTQERLELIGGNTSPKWMDSNQESFRTQALLGVLGKQAQDSIAALNKKRKKLEGMQARSEQTQEELRTIARTEMSVRDQLIEERKSRQKAAATLQTELNRHAVSLTRLKRDESRLSTLVAGLAKQEAQEAREAAQRAARRSAEKAAVNTQTSSKGRSSYPVEGKLVARYGEKRKEGKELGNWKGMVFSVKDETPVHAVKAGKVVFADYLRGYGNMIIVDHGGGYFSVYGNNARLDKDVGDRVGSGETISWVGSKDSDLSILYFEVRHKGRPIDPSTWL